MNPTETLEAITSNDNHRAWLGSWEIIRTPVSELKSFYLPHIEIIRSSVGKLEKPEGTYLRDSRDICKLAVKILEEVSLGNCRCVVYPATDQLLPENEEKHNLVKVVSKKDIPWEPEFICECKECAKLYTAKENHGYHYPLAKWSCKNA